MRSIGQFQYMDEQERTLKISRFVGYNKFGDPGDMPLQFSHGGYGFDTGQETLRPVQKDFVFDDLANAVVGHDSYAIISIFYYTRLSSGGLEERFLLAAVALTDDATTVVKILQRYLPRDVNDNSFSTLWSDITGSETPTAQCGRSFINCQQGTTSEVVFSNGGAEPYVWTGTGNIAKLNAALAPKGRMMAYYNDRVFISGVESSASVVWWSQSMAPNGWTVSSSGAGYLNVVPGLGDVITALHSNRMGLLVFLNDSTHRLYGAVPTEYQFSLVSREFGAINNHCVAEFGNVVFALDKSGLMYFDGSNVRPYMQEELSLPVDNAYFGVAPYKDRHALFAYAGRLYVYDGFSKLRYRINVAKKVIESVSRCDTVEFPCWVPMRDSCYSIAKDESNKDVIWQVGYGAVGRALIFGV